MASPSSFNISSLINLDYATVNPPSTYKDYAMGHINKPFVTITSILSILGSLTIILTFIAWKDIRTVTRHVLLCLSISDLLVGLGNICGTYFKPTPNDTKCTIQSFVTTSASIISCFWTATLALYLYLTVVKGKQILAKRMLVFFHLINWSVGPFINALAVHWRMLGNSADKMTAGWCWIKHSGIRKDRTKEIMWMLLDGKLAEFIAYGSILVLYILVKMRLGKELKARSKAAVKKPIRKIELKAARNADRKLVFIPVLLILARFWGTLRFLLFCFKKLPDQINAGHKILLTLQGIGDSSQGLLNCILFCIFTPTVYNRLKDFFLEKFCCVERKRGYQALSAQTANDQVSNGDSRAKKSSQFIDPLLSSDVTAKSYGTREN